MPANITPLPDAPSRTQASETFAVKADAFIAALPKFVAEANALSAEVNGESATASASAVSAQNSATAAANSAAAAAAGSNAAKWVSGTTYAQGDCRWSPLNYQTYRRKTAGAGTTDPSTDSTNWAPLVPQRIWSRQTASFSAASGGGYIINTTGGAVTLTLPAAPSQGDTVSLRNPAGTFAASNLTIDGNGKKVNGWDRLIIDVNYFSGELVYDSTDGWGL